MITITREALASAVASANLTASETLDVIAAVEAAAGFPPAAVQSSQGGDPVPWSAPLSPATYPKQSGPLSADCQDEPSGFRSQLPAPSQSSASSPPLTAAEIMRAYGLTVESAPTDKVA